MSKRKGNDGACSSQGQIVQIDEAQIKGHLDKMVRGTVEEMLNGLLDAEAEQLVGAGRYERSANRQYTRAGHYERSFGWCQDCFALLIQVSVLRRSASCSRPYPGRRWRRHVHETLRHDRHSRWTWILLIPAFATRLTHTLRGEALRRADGAAPRTSGSGAGMPQVPAADEATCNRPR